MGLAVVRGFYESPARETPNQLLSGASTHWRALFSASESGCESVHTREGERTSAVEDIVLRSRNAIRNSFAFKTARQAVVPSPRLTLRAPLQQWFTLLRRVKASPVSQNKLITKPRRDCACVSRSFSRSVYLGSST